MAGVTSSVLLPRTKAHAFETRAAMKAVCVLAVLSAVFASGGTGRDTTTDGHILESPVALTSDATAPVALPPLPRLGATGGTSVSGISSGADFAVRCCLANSHNDSISDFNCGQTIQSMCGCVCVATHHVALRGQLAIASPDVVASSARACVSAQHSHHPTLWPQHVSARRCVANCTCLVQTLGTRFVHLSRWGAVVQVCTASSALLANSSRGTTHLLHPSSSKWKVYFSIAHSASVVGAGVFAGNVYRCYQTRFAGDHVVSCASLQQRQYVTPSIPRLPRLPA
jgi:hypothetical protein